MKNLIYKELKLVLDPKIYIFSLLSGLIMIPNYPYMIGIAYFFLAVQIIFSTMKANKDLEFTALMPISRGSIVKSKYFTVIYLEAVQLVAAIPFALISSLLINKSG
ncbi:MAG TPA: ABC-2 transporter permease, partial [Clostridia bacterium]|nr:ABC-2 transporter permease [Clostridia bacterium]